jgi:two-component system, response regulator PdtaR
VLLLTAYSQRDLVMRAREAGVVGYLVKPFREADLVPAIEVALARFAEFRPSRSRSVTCTEALETRKFVDRAKGSSWTARACREAEAFRRIQKMSMNTRKPMKDVAEAIILAHQTQQQAVV